MASDSATRADFVRYLPVKGETTLERAAREQRIDEVFLKMLRKLEDQHQPVSPSRTSPSYAPKIFAALAEGKAYHVQDYKEAMQRLIDRRLIHIGEFGPKSRAAAFSAERTAAKRGVMSVVHLADSTRTPP